MPKIMPWPEAREHLPLSSIQEEVDHEIMKEVRLFNVTTYSTAIPLQVDPACLVTIKDQTPAKDLKVLRSIPEGDDQKYLQPGRFQLSMDNQKCTPKRDPE